MGLARESAGTARRRLAEALGLTGLLYGLFFLTLTPAFQVNDDVGIAWMLSGYLYGEPTALTVYVEPLLSIPLARLYAALPAVPWFGVFLYAVHFAVTAALACLALREGRARLPLLVLVLVVFQLPMLLRVSYTATAIAAAAAGAFLHFGSRATTPWPSALGGALLGLSFLLRSAVFASSALWLLGPWLASRGRVPLRRHVAFALGFVLLAAPALPLRQLAYAGPEWDEWERFFELRFALHGTPRLDSHPQVLEAAARAGWSANDLALFRSWFFTDREVYRVDALETLVDDTAGLALTRPLGDAVAQGIVHAYGPRLVLLGALAAVLLPARERRQRRGSLLMLAMLCGGLVYLASTLRLPPRLAEPLLFGTAAWLALLPAGRAPAWWTARPGLVRAGRVAAMALGLAAVTVQGALAARASEGHERGRRRLEAQLERVRSVDATGIFVTSGNALGWELLSPLASFGELPALRFVPLGWAAQSPPFEAHLRRLGIEDVQRAIAERPDVYLCATQGLARLYETYWLEHRGERVRLEPVQVVSGKRGVHVFRRQERDR